MNIRCIVVGDGAVGKTCMLSSYIDNSFPEDYKCLDFNNLTTNVTIDNMKVVFDLWDMPGQEDYDRLRLLSYTGAVDVFLLCFAINNITSAKNIKDKWHPELVHHGPQVPIVLVGTKLDVRQSKEKQPNSKQIISRSEGERMAKAIKAVKYLECSALTQDGLNAIFEEVVRAKLHKKDNGSRHKCAVL